MKVKNIDIDRHPIKMLISDFRIMAKIDDDMLKFYCNEDLFLLEVHQSADKESLDIILIEHEEYS